ncbi:MAG: LamG domain-containing protein, partial [Candidatus Omnitrophica bacterium]|nr:LamG domain-containing protein [Candidatus Omnitrophota bacterium]
PINNNNAALLGKMAHGGAYAGWEFHVGTVPEAAPGLLNVWLINTWGSSYIQVVATNIVLDDTWHHVAFTYDGSGSAAGVRIYVDGEDATGNADDSNFVDTLSGAILSDASMTIGSRDNGSAHFFTGAIREAAVWDTTLTPENIRYVYAHGLELPQSIRLTDARFTPPSTFSFDWNSTVGTSYRIESSTNLLDWSSVEENYPQGGATGNVTGYTNAVPTQPALYFRVRPAP